MADAESNIIINVDTSIGIAEIKNLQRQISSLNAELMRSGAQQAKSAQNIQRNLINNINATGKFAANVRTISSTAESFTSALEGNKLSMGQYFKYAGASTKTFGRLFKSEFATIEKVATERVKTLQTQYVKLGRDANGALKAISVRPLSLDMQNLSTQTALAAQKQQLFNQLLKQGSTNLLNFGKNTQWAGRQLMVGFTIPLGIMGSVAMKEFEKIEKQAIRFKRVYGDAFSSNAETDKALDDMRRLAEEFTKYGIAVEKTLELAADAAQMGLSGAALTAQVAQATRLAVLGEVEQQEALQTSVSVMNAFGIAAEDLASKIDFLNAVENETMTAISDLTIAIPKAAPVVKQLGGSVEDLAFFLTAMKEGGINASEGANALKSGLASIINPTEKTTEFLKQFDISIQSIVNSNAGDLKGTIFGIADALNGLDPLNRARAIEQLFGKFQFSRISTLFQNITKEGSQAQRVLELTRSSTEELAILSERELARVEESPLFKFQKAIESLQAALAPIGEEFVKAITPVIEFGRTLLERFNEMGDGAKNFAVVAATVVAGIGPILLMTFGLIANGVANLIKMFAAISNVMRGAGTSSNDLATSTEYMTQQQLEAAAVAASLDQTHSKLIQTFSAEAGAVDRLATSYGRAIIAQSSLLGINPETGLPTPVPGRRAATRPKKYNKGVVSVPGPKGAGDIVPAMLSPGEAVIPAKQSAKYSGLIRGMIDDSIPGYRFGLNPFANMLGRSRVAARMPQAALEQMISGGKKAGYSSAFTTGTGADYLTQSGSASPKTKAMRSNVERDLFGLDENTNPLARPTYGYARTSPIQALINKLFGFRGKQFNAVTSGKMVGDRGKNNMVELAPGRWITDPSWKPDTLKRYGDVDVVTKRSVAKRSQAMVGDALLDYERSKHYSMGLQNNLRFAPAPMRGASRAQLEKAMFERRLNNPFGSYKPDPINNPNSFTANPTPPYVETYTPGGFRVSEISKIIAKDRSTARQLQKLVDQAGLGIKVTPQNAPMAIKALSNIFGTRFQGGTEAVSSQSRRERYPQTEAGRRARALADLRGGSSKWLGAGFGRVDIPSQLKEDEIALKTYEKALGRKATPAEIKNLIGSDLVHKVPSTRTEIFNGEKVQVKNWDPQNLRRDHRLINQFLNDISGGKKSFLDSIDAKQLATRAGVSEKIAQQELQKLKLGTHPAATSNAYKVLSGVASFRSSPRARALESLIKLRMSDAGASSYMKLASKGLFDFKPDSELSAKAKARQNATLRRYEKQIEDIRTKSPTAVTEKPLKPKQPRRQAKATAKTPVRQPNSFSMSRILGAGGRMGAFAGLLGMLGLGASVMGSLQQNQYADGVVSVPGPKGKGDVVPAMLSPGEAVIPTKMARKYAPLISGMVNDSLPGFNDGLIPPPPIGGPSNPFASMPNQTPGAGVPVPMPQSPADQKRFGTAIGSAMGKAKELGKGVAAGASKVINDKVIGSMDDNRGLLGKVGRRAAIGLGNIAGNDIVDSKGNVINSGANANKGLFGVKPLSQSGSIVETNGRFFRVDDQGRKVRISNAAAQQSMQQQPAGARPRAGMGGLGGVAGMAGMGAMMYGMSGGPGADIASMAAMPLMMAPMLLPMLKNPIVLTVAALGGLTAGIIAIRSHFENLERQSADFAEKMGVGNDAMNVFAEAAGKVTATDIISRRRQSEESLLQIQPGKNTFGNNFIQSEAGQEMLSNVQKSIGTLGKQQTAEDLKQQLFNAVASGALDVGQARSIAASIGDQINDLDFGMNINAYLSGIYGANGENLLTDPLSITVEMIAKSETDISRAFSDFTDLADKYGDDAFTSFITGDSAKNQNYDDLLVDNIKSVRQEVAEAGFGWTTVVGDVLNPLGWVESLGSSIVVGLNEMGNSLGLVSDEQLEVSRSNDALVKSTSWWDRMLAEVNTNNEIATEQTESYGKMLGKVAGNLSNYQQALDATDVLYQKQIDSAEAAGELEKAEQWRDKQIDARQGVVERYAEAVGNLTSNFNNLSDTQQTKFFADLDERILSDIEDADVRSATEEVLDQLNAAVESGEITGEASFILKAQVDAGVLGVEDLKTFMSLTGSAKTTAMRLIPQMNPRDYTRIMELSKIFVDENGNPNNTLTTKFIAQFEGVDQAETDRLLSLFNKVSGLSPIIGEGATGKLGGFYLNDKSAAEGLVQDYKDIEDISKKEFKIEVIQELLGDDVAEIVGKDQEYFNSLDPVNKVVYLQVLATMALPVMIGEMDDDVLSWAAEQGKQLPNTLVSSINDDIMNSLRQDFAKNAPWMTTVSNMLGSLGEEETTPQPGSGTKKDPFLNILSRLKEVRDAAIDASGGIDALRAALAKGATAANEFVGIQQKLLFAGYGQEFISSIRGMDEETRKDFVTIENGVVKVTEAGKLMNKAFAEVTLGDFQSSLVGGISAANMQTRAMKKLKDAGLDVGEAFEITQDEALAYAIATNATTEEVKDFVKWLGELEEKQRELQLSTPEGVQDWLEDYSGAVSSATSIARQFFDVQKTITDEDFMSGTNVGGRNEDLVNIGEILDEIEKSQEKIGEYRFDIENLEYDLSSIKDQEEEINEKYDERLEALDKIFEANSDIAEQQKSQLDIVTALSSGDIAAAAKAVQQERIRASERERETRESAIERQRESELQGVRSENGKTRKQLEAEIFDLTKKIREEEAKVLADSQRRLTIAEQNRDVALEAIGEDGYLGQTEKGWKAIEDAARLAVVQSDAFRDSLIAIVKSIPGMSFDAEGNLTFDSEEFKNQLEVETGTGGKPAGESVKTKTSVYQAQGVTVLDRDAAAKAAINAVKTGQASDPLAFANQVKEQVLANRAAVRDRSSTISDAEKKRLTQENINLMQTTGLKFATGGMVPAYLRMGGLLPYKSEGGSIFKPLGTDTVPAMLTPGEFVVRKYAVDNFGVDRLSAINSGTYNGESVYNYNLSVNVKSEANPNEIAKTVMTQIRQVDSMRLRGNRF